MACALNAAAAARVSVRIVAVEKNRHAVVTLRNRILSERWGNNVTLLDIDMRDWDPGPDQQVDIVVSELLGSWGDNELSPECLDGAEKCLKPGGISIPCDYTSFLAPISASKIWTNARDLPKVRWIQTLLYTSLHVTSLHLSIREDSINQSFLQFVFVPKLILFSFRPSYLRALIRLSLLSCTTTFHYRNPYRFFVSIILGGTLCGTLMSGAFYLLLLLYI